MERLTTRNEDGQACTGEKQYSVIQWDMIEKLADYEDAEEQGYIKLCPNCGSLMVGTYNCDNCGENL
jgi:hypothetical protein